MKSLQDVVDGFKRLAKHEKQNIKKYVKIVRVTNIVDHMI
jgi:predicted GIY-YIG superfamily endonuclease